MLPSLSCPITSRAPHPPRVSHVTLHFPAFTLCDVYRRAKSDLGMQVLGSQTMRYTALSSALYRGFPAPASQPQDSVPRQLSSDAAQGDVGSACAAFAVAGNLTCKSRGEVCLGTTLGTAIPYDRQVFHKSKMLLFLNEIKLKKTPVGWKVIQ